MPGKTMFLLRIQPGMEAEFEERWQREVSVLKRFKGFRGRELIRVVTSPSTYVVLSEWDSPDDYFVWRNSPDRARIYEGDLAPLFSAPPVTGVGEVVAQMA